MIKSTATNYLLKGGPTAAFSSPKEFFEWCWKRNDRLVIGRAQRNQPLQYQSACLAEPNRPIEVR